MDFLSDQTSLDILNFMDFLNLVVQLAGPADTMDYHTAELATAMSRAQWTNFVARPLATVNANLETHFSTTLATNAIP